MIDQPVQEKELIDRARQGDRKAFGSLIDLYWKLIYKLAYKLCGDLNDADDLTQETFIAAFRRLGEFKQKSRFTTWLYRIAVNLQRNCGRHWRKLQFISLDVPQEDEEGGEINAQFEDKKQSLEELETAALIKEALAVLSPEVRTVIVLRYLEGYTLEEIAEICKIPSNTVSTRIFRGLDQLRKYFKEREM